MTNNNNDTMKYGTTTRPILLHATTTATPVTTSTATATTIATTNLNRGGSKVLQLEGGGAGCV